MSCLEVHICGWTVHSAKLRRTFHLWSSPGRTRLVGCNSVQHSLVQCISNVHDRGQVWCFSVFSPTVYAVPVWRVPPSGASIDLQHPRSPYSQKTMFAFVLAFVRTFRGTSFVSTSQAVFLSCPSRWHSAHMSCLEVHFCGWTVASVALRPNFHLWSSTVETWLVGCNSM